MSAMHRLKAYFGMVPAEEMDAYLDYTDDLDAPENAPERAPREDRPRWADRQSTRPAATTNAPVDGSLAVDPASIPLASAGPRPSVAPAPHDLSARPAIAKITTLQPRSYNEARTIGERYRDGVPVIMNLTELDDAAAKRLVDFAAGLAFALRGSIDKVTSRVFLLTPADVEVSADDARRLAERGLFRQD
jgi:cell division inhibitor SepF